ncbi:cobaltochelatase subunit CobN [Rhodoligotrophos defluvii]|uniref:cobaltochelatase subunit CobN n=1 Tax=Rhodoligotrophos defluvii TaxID=2561934 RepID=UPI0010C9364D|nr:cobaltochelatase subunit CobN [Rhodoligotrophos defluvii]
MHLLVRETHSLDEADAAVDLDHAPADMAFLSFSDSDLGAVAAAYVRGAQGLPGLRMANLGRLRHPMSVDLYLDKTLRHARVIIVRLLGGLDYWRYGAQELSSLCRERSIALALLDGDNRVDDRLEAMSTVSPEALDRLRDYFRHGGPDNMAAALRLAAHLAGIGADDGPSATPLPAAGVLDLGPCPLPPEAAKAAIILYRAYVLADDVAPVHALAAALVEAGIAPHALYVTSLKDPASAAFIADELSRLRPDVILNLTAFSARRDEDGVSPLDMADVPVLQLVLSGAARAAWASSSRGLSEADLAMHVVLPELDGRLLTTAISFKADQPVGAGVDITRTVHEPDRDGVALAVARAKGWVRLRRTPWPERRIAVVLSDYPGAQGQVAHAVGLDALASTAEILRLLSDAGYEAGADAEVVCAALRQGEARPVLSGADYRRLFATLPAALRERIEAAWGAPEQDPAYGDGAFHFAVHAVGRITIAIQPDRGQGLDRKAQYHDPDLPPRHAYVAFYLWLREVERVHAMVHLGTHGTLEWLPGKAVALSRHCAPTALLGGLPVVYPFIVNNPGEAAAAKRRLGAVTIGHLTPPLQSAGSHGAAAELEKLIDEYAAADGLDRRRMALLKRDILERAADLGLLEESGASAAADEDEALARLDAYLCDVKDLQIRDGLHVFGRAPEEARRDALASAIAASAPGLAPDAIVRRLDACAEAERQALLAALDGRFVAPGPAGAPSRGRVDVLPTGRNLFTVDPRAIPTRSALVLAEKTARELIRRHMQETGEWLCSVVLDLWGSTTIRTGGEDLALALVLMGVRPLWDSGSNRVSGIEVVPEARLDHPRVDVTLRISGLFRDAFGQQIALFDQAVRTLADRADEADGFNPYADAARGLKGEARLRALVRVYGNAPGAYGAGVSTLIERGAWEDRAALGGAYLEASAHAYGLSFAGEADLSGFTARLEAAQALVHLQDHREIDLLDSLDFAGHEGGFAAAAESLGREPQLYHADTADPNAPKLRTVAEEVRRIVRGRAANPRWIEGMMRHGYRGAAEIARGLDGLFGFAATLGSRFDRQFELIFDATLGCEPVDAFLRRENPQARAAMAARFAEAVRRDLWRPRRNAVATLLAEHEELRP